VTTMSIRFVTFLALLTAAPTECAPSRAQSVPPPNAYVSFEVERLGDSTGGTISDNVRAAITHELTKSLRDAGFAIATKFSARPTAILRSSVLSCHEQTGEPTTIPDAAIGGCFVTITVVDNQTKHVVTNFVVNMPTLGETRAASDHPGRTGANNTASARAIAHETARQLGRMQDVTAPAVSSEDITAGGAHIAYQGSGVFLVSSPWAGRKGERGTAIIDLAHIRHGYDPSVDEDVPYYTNITLNDRVPPLFDKTGQEYALITLYQIDPPLVAQASKELGIYRGMDFRDPADLVKSAYSNYVSPVLTLDRDNRRVASHPIGHFYVKVEIPGYPTVLTGMTTIRRADTELANLTLGRELGIGGVLLTPEPGRLNSASEALEELTLRQRELRVVDGLYYRRAWGRNVGPEYVLKNGNVVFARFRVPSKNAKDAMAFFVEFVARGEHNIFGSLINRPNKGTGAGCTPFAISWLEASGVIPFVAEPAAIRSIDDPAVGTFGATDFWKYVHRTIHIPWRHIGCDDRLGVDRIIPADYTVYDLLFHNERKEFVKQASEGLAQKIKEDYGLVSGTLFQFGALTPLRDLVISSKRKDPDDIGDYNWAKGDEGLAAPFWDNSRFSNWIKQLWTRGPKTPEIVLVRDGRFDGIEVDGMTVARQQEPFFAEADRVAEKRRRMEMSGARPSSCEQLFSLGIQ
jgi:hypothetical protein